MTSCGESNIFWLIFWSIYHRYGVNKSEVCYILPFCGLLAVVVFLNSFASNFKMIYFSCGTAKYLGKQNSKFLVNLLQYLPDGSSQWLVSWCIVVFKTTITNYLVNSQLVVWFEDQIVSQLFGLKINYLKQLTINY